MSDDFMNVLHSKAQECGYTDAHRHKCEQFTVMIDDTKMQDELLAKLSDTSTPEEALKNTCKIEAQVQQKSATQQEHKEFSPVQRGRGGAMEVVAEVDIMVSDTDQNQVLVGCRFCRRSHPPKQCPTWGKECRKCGKKTHFENKCRSDRYQSWDNNRKENHDKSQSQCNRSQYHNKKFHEGDKDDGFGDCMLQQPIKNLDEINLTIILTLFM